MASRACPARPAHHQGEPNGDPRAGDRSAQKSRTTFSVAPVSATSSTISTRAPERSTVLGAGGNLSHHHGVGLNRGRFVDEALGAGIEVLRAIKAALDPAGILNPGKLGLPSTVRSAPWP